ncbi:MAG: hypothetical protein ACP5I4_14365 [Oceanipulchritudo sp.]
MKIRSIHAFPLALLLFHGCSTPPPAPVEEVVTVKPTHYLVVPMESPLLRLSGRASEAGMTVPDSLTAERGWSPGEWLAEEVQRQIRMSGRAASRADRTLPVEGSAGQAGLSVEAAWLDPVRQWYDSGREASDYTVTAPDFATDVLEVGLANYSIEDLNLYLSVLIKVVDVETGRVTGRARVFSTTDLRPEDAFQDDARLFRETFAKTGRQLVEKCLEQLGLR